MRRLLRAVIGGFVFVVIIIAALMYLDSGKSGDPSGYQNNTQPNVPGNINSADTVSEEDTSQEKAGKGSDTDNTSSSGTQNTNKDNIVLTETRDAGREYTDETLFLGDSNTAMFLKYSDPKGQAYSTKKNTIGIVSMGIEHISKLRCMSFSTGLLTMPQAAAVIQPRRIIMMFGTNDLMYGAESASRFAQLYAEKIREIQSACPYADIIINSVLPATSDTYFSNAAIDTIREFNRQFLKMCTDNGWKFLYSFEAFTDSSGCGDPELFQADGLHLNAAGVETMFGYIRSHALLTEDRRTMPLDPVPEIYGPVVDLIAPMP